MLDVRPGDPRRRPEQRPHGAAGARAGAGHEHPEIAQLFAAAMQGKLDRGGAGLLRSDVQQVSAVRQQQVVERGRGIRGHRSILAGCGDISISSGMCRSVRGEG